MTPLDEQARAIVVAWMDRCLPLQELLANPHHAWLIQSLALDIAAALRQRVEALEQEKLDREPDPRVWVTLSDHEKEVAVLTAKLEACEQERDKLQSWFDAVAASGVVDSSVQTSEEFIAWMKAQRARLAVLEGALKAVIGCLKNRDRHLPDPKAMIFACEQALQGYPATREKGEG